MPNICWPWSIESRAGPFWQLLAAHIGLLYNSWRRPLWGGLRLSLAWPEDKQHDLRNIYFKSQIRTMQCKEVKSIPALSLLASMNSLHGNVHFMSQLVKGSRPYILQLVYLTDRQNFTTHLPPIHKVATLLTRVILWVRLLGPVPIKCESVLGGSTGTAV